MEQKSWTRGTIKSWQYETLYEDSFFPTNDVAKAAYNMFLHLWVMIVSKVITKPLICNEDLCFLNKDWSPIGEIQ